MESEVGDIWVQRGEIIGMLKYRKWWFQDLNIFFIGEKGIVILNLKVVRLN